MSLADFSVMSYSSNGCVMDGDRPVIYYGVADEFVCGAYFSINEILGTMGFGSLGDKDKSNL